MKATTAKNKQYSVYQNRFGPSLNEFKFRVPYNYIHEKQLETFSRANKHKFYYYCNALNDENFAKTTTRLFPGQLYHVKIFRILKTVNSEECLEFLESQGAISLNAQGLSLIWDLKKDKLHINDFIISLDRKDALWMDGNNTRVARIYSYNNGKWGFGLGSFETNCVPGNCLLGCFLLC